MVSKGIDFIGQFPSPRGRSKVGLKMVLGLCSVMLVPQLFSSQTNIDILCVDSAICINETVSMINPGILEDSLFQLGDFYILASFIKSGDSLQVLQT